MTNACICSLYYTSAPSQIFTAASIFISYFCSDFFIILKPSSVSFFLASVIYPVLQCVEEDVCFCLSNGVYNAVQIWRGFSSRLISVHINLLQGGLCFHQGWYVDLFILEQNYSRNYEHTFMERSRWFGCGVRNNPLHLGYDKNQGDKI